MCHIHAWLPLKGFPGGSDDKESACEAGDWCSIPGLGISPGKGNGSLLPLYNYFTCSFNTNC